MNARTAAAHPNMNMPELISTLFRLEAAEFARRRAEWKEEGVAALILRCMLAISPLDDVRGWMAEINRDFKEDRRPTEEQLARFGNVL